MDSQWMVAMLLFFVAGCYFYGRYGGTKEGFTTDDPPRCPDLLIQKGPHYYLYNTKLGTVPGVNPIEFHNLEEYVEFLEWQKGVGIRCPVLYLQQSYDTQGNRVYKVRPSVSELQGGLPSSQFTKLVDASHGDKPYNQGGYPAYDPTSFYVGEITPLDTMKQSSVSKVSDDAMDPTWGGQDYTQSLVDSHQYAGNEVSLRVA